MHVRRKKYPILPFTAGWTLFFQVEIWRSAKRAEKEEEFPPITAQMEMNASHLSHYGHARGNGQTDLHTKKEQPLKKSDGNQGFTPAARTCTSQYKANAQTCHIERRGNFVREEFGNVKRIVPTTRHWYSAHLRGVCCLFKINCPLQHRNGPAWHSHFKRHPITLQRVVVLLSSDRGIAWYYICTYIEKIYTPWVAASRAERKEFYHVHLPYLFRSSAQHYILGGDFKCVLWWSYCKRKPNVNKGLWRDWGEGLVVTRRNPHGGHLF